MENIGKISFMENIGQLIINLFKVYGVWAGLGLLFLYGLFYKVFPVMIDVVKNFVDVVKGLGDKIEAASEKTSKDLAAIMTEFREDRRLSREAHKVEIESLLSNNERMVNQFINMTKGGLVNGSAKV